MSNVAQFKIWTKHVIPLDNNKGKVLVQAMKAYGGVDIQLHPFLTLLRDGGEWSDSHPGHFTPGDMVPSTHWIGGWVGTRATADTAEMCPVPATDQTTILQLPAHSLFTTYTNYAVPFPWTTNAFFSFCLTVAVSSLSCSTATVISLLPDEEKNWPPSTYQAILTSQVCMLFIICHCHSTIERRYELYNQSNAKLYICKLFVAPSVMK